MVRKRGKMAKLKTPTRRKNEKKQGGLNPRLRDPFIGTKRDMRLLVFFVERRTSAAKRKKRFRDHNGGKSPCAPQLGGEDLMPTKVGTAG